MHTEQLALRSLHRRSERERLKRIDDGVPKLSGVVCDFVEDFVEEAVPRADLCVLVVSSQYVHFVRVQYFQTKQEYYGFDRVSSAIDVVPQKQVVRLSSRTRYLENLKQIVELTVQVPYDRDRGLEAQQ